MSKAKEWLQKRYRWYLEKWNEHEEIDDEWTAQMLTEYRADTLSEVREIVEQRRLAKDPIDSILAKLKELEE